MKKKVSRMVAPKNTGVVPNKTFRDHSRRGPWNLVQALNLRRYLGNCIPGKLGWRQQFKSEKGEAAGDLHGRYDLIGNEQSIHARGR